MSQIYFGKIDIKNREGVLIIRKKLECTPKNKKKLMPNMLNTIYTTLITSNKDIIENIEKYIAEELEKLFKRDDYLTILHKKEKIKVKVIDVKTYSDAKKEIEYHFYFKFDIVKTI